jgi:hypothetical protein
MQTKLGFTNVHSHRGRIYESGIGFTSRSPAGDGGPEDALLGGEVDLDGGIAARIVDLASEDLLDRHGGESGGINRLRREADNDLEPRETDDDWQRNIFGTKMEAAVIFK